jgi:hypothetical protein
VKQPFTSLLERSSLVLLLPLFFTLRNKANMQTMDNLSLKNVENKIINTPSDYFIISRNYEILNPKDGKNILNYRCHDAKAVKVAFDKLYESNGSFVSNDLELDSRIFIQRLTALGNLLKKTGEDARHVFQIINNIRAVEGVLKIKALTLRIFDDLRTPVYFRCLMTQDAREVLHGFCQQWEVEKQELLYVLEQLTA